MKMVVNIGRIEEIVGDKIELRDLLLDLFLKTFDKILNNLQGALGSDALAKKKWYAGVHELKGAALNLGFKDLANYCAEIEHEVLSKEEKQKTLKVFTAARADVAKIIVK